MSASVHLGLGRFTSSAVPMSPAVIPARACAATARVPSFQVVGPPSAPLVAVLGGITASSRVCATRFDATPGWWDVLAGPGKAIDTDRYRVVGIDYLDGGAGDAGRPRQTVTTGDQADALASVLDHIGVPAVHAVVGASYGGMVALAFAERHPRRAGRLVVIAAAHRTHPMATARRSVQRRIVELGLDTGREREALALARALAMTTYRSAAEFAGRFGHAPIPVEAASRFPIEPAPRFPVEHYLDHHGNRFASTWTAARFLALSLSADLHTAVPEAIDVPSTLIAIEDDEIVPVAEMRVLAERLRVPRLHVVPAGGGHDAFLTRPDVIAPVLRTALAAAVRT
jgi:homoserine O-acetyltransferase